MREPIEFQYPYKQETPEPGWGAVLRFLFWFSILIAALVYFQ